MRERERDDRVPGVWWLPEEPDDRIAGALRPHQVDTLTLELVGAFRCPQEKNLWLGRVFGLIGGDRPVTLERCHYRSMRSWGSISTSEVITDLVIIGAHIPPGEELTLPELGFTIGGAASWWAPNAMAGLGETRLDFHPPPARRIQITSERSVELDCRCEGHWSLDSATLAVKLVAMFHSHEPVPATEFVEQVCRLTRFFSLFTNGQHRALHGFTENNHRVELYFTDNRLPANQDSRSADITLTSKHLENCLDVVLQRWFSTYDAIVPVLDAFFASRSGLVSYVDTRFLLLVQALEAFHRRTQPRQFRLERSEFDLIVNQMVAACPPERKKWFRERLKYSNEVSLRRRLKDLFEPFADHFGDNKTVQDLIQRIVDTRNYLAHYGDSPKDGLRHRHEFARVSMQLDALQQLHLLNHLDPTGRLSRDSAEYSWSLKERFKGIRNIP
jgi:hypothetical protein